MDPKGKPDRRAAARSVSLVLSVLTAAALQPMDSHSQGGSPSLGVHPGYQLVNIPLQGFNKAFTGLAFLPNGKMVAVTYRGTMDKPGYLTTPFKRSTFGQVYLLENLQGDPGGVRHTLIADSLVDAMGACVVEGRIYIGELDRILKLEDKDGDGRYEKELVARFPARDGYFEYAFGPVFKDGHLYMGLGVHTKMTGEPEVQFVEDRGTLIRIPIGGGKHEVVASGIRNPDGLALGPDSQLFITDNQGGWRPAAAFIHVQPGKFFGYRNVGDTITKPVTPPSMWLPYGELNNSPTEPVLLETGPYQGQFLYGDFGNQRLARAFLDPIRDTYQGAVFPFSGGLRYAAHRMAIDGQGVIYIGGIVLEGGTTGPQKLVPKPAAEVFDMLAIRARMGGLEIEFTQPLGAMASRRSMFALKHWHYAPTSTYGGPKQSVADLSVSNLQISKDSTRVFLAIGGLAAGKVIQVSLSDSLKSRSGKSLWNREGYYTLNSLSDSPPLTTPARAWRAAAPALSVHKAGGSIQVRWGGSDFTTLAVRDVRGSVLNRFDITGLKSFDLPKGSHPHRLLVIKLTGRASSAAAVAVSDL